MTLDRRTPHFCRRLAAACAAFLGAALFGFAAAAPALASCAGMAEAPRLTHPYFMRAAAPAAAPRVPDGQLRIRFVGHATFEIESPQGAMVQTDFNDWVRSHRLPDIVTMNRTHDSHFSYGPPEGIPHVLRGWDPDGGIARHNVLFKDVRVRNVPTNLAPVGGGKFANGNSMFVIEAVGLCVVHISHLHHYLSPEQLRELGIIDVAFAPIDGMWTMSHDELFRVLGDIRARLVIPMHYGSQQGVQEFIARAEKNWTVRRADSDTMFVSLATMPQKPEVVFLQGH
jgi:L-ascorbate metabolism protein UlaG (beta-lactamase superfamily)